MLLLSFRLAAYGPISKRVLVAAIVASLATLLFTPVVWGSDSFGFIVPWVVMLLSGGHTDFHWASPASVFALSFVINVLSGRASRAGSLFRSRGT